MYMETIKKMLCRELEEYAKQNKISGSDLEMVWKLTDTVKNIDKIEMLEEESGYSGRRYSMGSSYDDDMMYRRMERHPHEYSGRRGYSRDEAKDKLMDRLGEAMTDADPNEREILKQAMRKIEKA